MKKLCLLLCLLLALTSCGNKTEPKKNEEAKNNQQISDKENSEKEKPQDNVDKLDDIKDQVKDDAEELEKELEEENDEPKNYENLRLFMDDLEDIEGVKGNIIDIAQSANATNVLTKDKRIISKSVVDAKELGKFDNVVKLRHELSVNSVLAAEQDDGKFILINPSSPDSLMKDIEMKNPVGVLGNWGDFVFFTLEDGYLYLNGLDRAQGSEEIKYTKQRILPDENLDFMMSNDNKKLYKGKILDAYAHYESLIVHTEEGKLYVLEPTYNPGSENLPSEIEYHLRPAYGITENVDKIYKSGTLGLDPYPPIYTVKGDQDNIYFNSVNNLEVQRDKAPLPEGVKIDNVKEAYSEGGLFIITNDNKAYSFNDIEDDREWKELPGIAKLSQEGKIKKIVTNSMDNIVLLDDGNIYEVE